MSAKRMSVDGAKLQQVHLRVADGEQGHLKLTLTAASVDMPALGWRDARMRLAGNLTRGGEGIWTLDGHIAVHGAPGGMLADSAIRVGMDVDADNLEVSVAQGATKVNAALPLDQPSHARIKLDKLPLKWLQGLLARAWSGRVTSGHLSGTVALDIASSGVRSSGDISLSGAGFESKDGTLAGKKLNARGHMTLDTTAADAKIKTDLNLRGGELLFGSFYARLPQHDVHLALDASAKAHETVLRTLRFTDPNTLQLAGSMILGADGSVRGIHFSRIHAALPAAYEHYAKTWLATLGLSHLTTRGQLQGSLWRDAKGWREFRFDANNLDLDNGSGLAVSGLNGGLDWQRGGARPATTMSWKKLRFHSIPLGAAKSRWRTRKGRLALQAPLAVSVFGGRLQVRGLSWNPQSDQRRHLDTSLVVTGVDVKRLSEALGWPAFPGTLAGAIPGLRYVGDHIELDGGLSLNVFDGYVNVTQLSLKHPFGSAPALSADIGMNNLDLGAITSVFDFGRITGRMDGRIENLRMVDWKPVAFAGSMHTVGKGRISQRAVKNLTSVGGGGVAAGLQGAVLKLFKSFGYKRIGLSCTLKGAVCRMSGLEPADDGYLIVEGRGLPHLTVIGHEHDVSWPTLLSRLKAAIESGGPVVE